MAAATSKTAIFKVSKWLHKYIGLGLILFMVWTSISGILMNHPGLVSGVSVPGWLVPPQYHVRNWNRSSLVTLEFSKRNPDVAYLAGKQGIWKTGDGYRNFTPMMDGLPRSQYYRKAKDLLLLEEESLLLAATEGGLYRCDLVSEKWYKIPLANKGEPVLRILHAGEKLIAVTPFHVYASPNPPATIAFRPLAIGRDEPQARVSLVKLFFDLHNGEAWGIGGKLLFDATGLILVFLSISAFYTWYFPWQKRRRKASRLLTNPRSRTVFKYMFKYHLKLGIWICAILLLIGGTGLFMRPPLLVALVGKDMPAGLYPGLHEDSPWNDKIQNALFDETTGELLLQCTDGFWQGNPQAGTVFRKADSTVPVFVMGSTVLEARTDGALVGSFNGIYNWNRNTNAATDVLNERAANGVSPVRPAEIMVTGYFRTPVGEEFITAHEQGLLPLRGAALNGRFQMPSELLDDFRLPLWNYLFEIHNGRFFQDLVGTWYLLIVPLGSLLFVVITLSGLYDWLYLNVLHRLKAGNGL